MTERNRVLRLSLLRAPFMRKEFGEAKELDEVLGLGPFSFAYAVMPHAGDWREADLPKRGHEFNYDLLAVRHDRPDLVDRRIHERVYTGLRREPHVFIAAGGSSALLTVVKRAEEGDALILRLVETLGQKATARIAFHHAIQGAVDAICSNARRIEVRAPSNRPVVSPSKAPASRFCCSRLRSRRSDCAFSRKTP